MKNVYWYEINETWRDCTRCKTFKTWDQFNVNKKCPWGKNQMCRECEAKRRAEMYGRYYIPKRPFIITDTARECSVCSILLSLDNFAIGCNKKPMATCKKCRKKQNNAPEKRHSTKIEAKSYDPDFIYDQRKRFDERAKEEEKSARKERYWEK